MWYNIGSRGWENHIWNDSSHWCYLGPFSLIDKRKGPCLQKTFTPLRASFLSLLPEKAGECNTRLLLSQPCSGRDAVMQSSSENLETPARLHPEIARPFLTSQNPRTNRAMGTELLRSPEVRSHRSPSLPHPPLPTSFIATKCSLWNVWRWGFRSGQPVKNMNCYHELWVAFQLCWQKFTPCRPLPPPPPTKKLSR